MGNTTSTRTELPPGYAVGKYYVYNKTFGSDWVRIMGVADGRVQLALLPEVKCESESDTAAATRTCSLSLDDVKRKLSPASWYAKNDNLHRVSAVRRFGPRYRYSALYAPEEVYDAWIVAMDVGKRRMSLHLITRGGVSVFRETSLYDLDLWMPVTDDMPLHTIPMPLRLRVAKQRKFTLEIATEKRQRAEAERQRVEASEAGQLECARALVHEAEKKKQPPPPVALDEKGSGGGGTLHVGDGTGNVCSVCMVAQRFRVFPCGHFFCGACATRVVTGPQKTCPLCRAPASTHAAVFL